MRHDIQVLDRIRKTYASLRPSEQRVADYVLNHPETCTQQTISELADQVQVSQPTVVRFVQALGFGGFRNFKYCLLRDRSQGTEREAYFDHLGGFDLKPWDQLEDLPLKEVRVSGGLLEAALKSLSPQELDRAVRMLATARTIDIYGVENSCTPAGDLLTKLTYLGLCCRMNTDAYLQQIGAAHLGVADVAVAFSHSGCSMDTVKALKLAQKAGGWHHRHHQPEKSPPGPVRRCVPLHRGRGGGDLRHRHLLSHLRPGGGGPAVHGDHSERLRALLPQSGQERRGHRRPGLSGGVRGSGGGFSCKKITRKAPAF